MNTAGAISIIKDTCYDYKPSTITKIKEEHDCNDDKDVNTMRYC